MKTVIVIPTYNEKQNIARLIPIIFNTVKENLEIIVVDDNSPDNTSQIVIDWQTIYPDSIHLIKREKKLGLGSAYIAGFKKALEIGAGLIMEMDADFSHNPKDIPKLIDACREDADLSIGSRKIPDGKIEGWGWYRKLMSNGAMFLARLILNLKTRDVTSGFRCYKRKVLENIGIEKITSNGYAFQEELVYRTEKAGFVIKEIPVTFVDRKIGKSKLSTKDILEFFITIVRLKLKNP